MISQPLAGRTILDLCGGTGSWSKPYADAGYNVRIVDNGLNGFDAQDVRFFKKFDTEFLKPIHGVLAAPPCTHFSGSGARWWREKGDVALLDGLSIVDACLRIVLIENPTFWCLENPVGRLNHYIGKPKHYFHPHFYGDGYTKKTALWGNFNMPGQTHFLNESEIDDRIHKMPPSKDRAKLRSITPPGFAKAFFEANP